MAKKILVVEDDPAVREVLTQRLGAQGYEVCSAADGGSALRQVATDRPDLILLDMMLPDIQGSTVCARLKSDDAFRSIPIVILTARDQDYDRDIGRAVKADAYLTKPFESAVLLRTIRDLIAGV